MAYSESIYSLCKQFNRENINKYIIPSFLALLKDENPEVRSSLFKNIKILMKALGAETLSQSIIPAIIELGANKNWRIRNCAIANIFFLTESLVSRS